MGGFDRGGAANRTLDARTGNELRNRSRKHKVRREPAATRRDRHEPAGTVNERSHGGCGDLDGGFGGDFQIYGRPAGVYLLGAWGAVTKRYILAGVDAFI